MSLVRDVAGAVARWFTIPSLERQGWTIQPELVPPWGIGPDIGVRVDRTSALGLSAVWACIRLLSSTVSRMPIDVLIDDGGTPRPYRAPRWLRRPIIGNPNHGRVEHFSQVMFSALSDGNFFVLTPRDDSNDVSELFVLDPERVEITGTIAAPGYKVRTNTGSVEYGPNEILHRPLVPIPGSQRGVSPLEAARLMFSVGLASQEYAARFFSQDATPPGYIAVPQGSKVTAQELRSGWVEKHAGPQNWHAPGVLTGGAEWKGITITHEQAQFLEQRQFSVAEIARFYGVAPHLIGDVERSTSWGTGIEQQGLGFVTYTLNDYLVMFEEAYSALVPNPDSYIRFNRNALLRGDAKSRAEYYQLRWQLGSMSADEIRAKEDEPPLPNGEGKTYYFQSSNFSPITGATNALDRPAGQPVSGQSSVGGTQANGQEPSGLSSDSSEWITTGGGSLRERGERNGS